jgi:hypothetical protein
VVISAVIKALVKHNNLTRCLGFNVVHDTFNRTLTISKDDYAFSIVKEYQKYISHIPFQRVCLPDAVQLTRDQCPKTEDEKEIMAQLPFRQIMGKLNYYTCTLRADINFAVNYLARFMDNPGHAHWLCLLHLLAYIRDWPHATISYGNPSRTTYTLDGVLHHMEPNRLYCFVDADFASSDLEICDGIFNFHQRRIDKLEECIAKTNQRQLHGSRIQSFE